MNLFDLFFPGRKIMQVLDDLKASVAANAAGIDTAVANIAALKAQIANLPADDTAALVDLKAQLDAATAKLAAA